MNLYERLGEEKISAVITEFYLRAFQDPIIGHFFHNRDRLSLTQKQIDFAVGMMGGPKRYRGGPLDLVHAEFTIRKPHFDRRQVIMREVLEEKNTPKLDLEEWLLLEDRLRKLILTLKDAVETQKTHASTQQP